ncbi:hypothetical protein F4777DRAFT_467397 [Nemania sp. FL0916]|nr:hypothetical protein F4777DRAFT_467397 [Nemania sp. FL0916]
MAILGDHDTHMNLFGKILDYTVNDLVIYSIHTKMNWACGRQSTRKEDIAYSLMGIFDVNMPLLYGEGGARAFQRLQEQIIKHSDDQSILLLSCAHSPLAQRPDDFKSPVVFERSPAEGRHSLQLAKYSVDVSLLLYTSEARIDTPLAKRTIGILENTFEGDPTKLDRPAIALQKLDKEGQYSRDSTVPFYQVRHNEAGKLEMIGDPEGKEYIIFTLDHSRLTREVVRLLLPFYRDRELSHDTILHRIFLPPINITTTSGKGAKYTKCCPDPQGGVISSSGIACDSSRLVACLVLQPDPADERFVAVIIYESAQRRLLPHLIDLQKWGEKQAIEPSMVHEIFDLASASKILQLDLYLRTMPFGTFANPWTEELKLVSIKRSSGCSIACRLVKKTVLESEVHHIEITIPAHTALRDQLG